MPKNTKDKPLHRPEFVAKVAEFACRVSTMRTFHYESLGSLTNAMRVKIEFLTKYVRVLADDGDDDCRIYCFIDEHGNILKPATWCAPAKHPRGNIFNPECDIDKMTVYGPPYLN